MEYKTIKAKYEEVMEKSGNGIKKDVMIAELEEKGIKVEGDKFGFINEGKVEEVEMVFKSISERIRYMYDMGEKQSKIAKELGIRDQFVSNVVRKYKESKVEVVEE